MHIQWSPLSARNMPLRPHTRSVLINSHTSQQNFTRTVSARSLGQRTQAGHTNRWQLPGALGSDLLGQAQVQRAEEFGNKSSDRKNNSDDPMALYWHEDATSCPQSPLPRLVHPLSASRRTRLCKDVTWSSKLDTPEERFYILSRRVVHNAKPGNGSLCEFTKYNMFLDQHLCCSWNNILINQSDLSDTFTVYAYNYTLRKKDAVLECLGIRWELHCPILSSSDTLFELYTNSKRQRDVELQKRAVIGKDSRVSSSACGRGLVNRKWLSSPLTLRLPVKDASINKEALSFALRTLYNPEECTEEWGEAVLSTAALLGMSNLFQKCLKEMLTRISSSTVCSFHQVSCKFKETLLQRACERWLELFLVTELSFHIKLKDLPFDLLLTTLRSPRLFASNEYEVLRAVLYWLYLKLNPLRETLPAHSTIIHFFSRETAVFLEQPQGQKYITIFQALRMHGINEWHHLQELQNIRVLPESWLLSILSNHYHTLYSGGDMVVTDFSKQAIRFGMMFDREQECCTQTISLCGYYFLLQAAKLGESDTYNFSIERLRHLDPAVSQSSIVSHPYCMRPDRSVCYHITVQSFANGKWQEHSSGPVNQEFGLFKRRCRSKPFQIEGLFPPILVTFALAFPF